MKTEKRKVKVVTCSNTQETIMLYHEKRIKPLKSVALHWHINKCTDCRELFLAMDKAGEYEIEALDTGTANLVPEGFTKAVMAKISAIPLSERPVALGRLTAPGHPMESKSAARKTPSDWMRLAGCVYALLLAAGLGVLYNTELIQIPYYNLGALEQINAFLNNLSQAGQYADTLTMAGGFGSPILVIAVVLGLALAFMLRREKAFGKKI